MNENKLVHALYAAARGDKVLCYCFDLREVIEALEACDKIALMSEVLPSYRIKPQERRFLFNNAGSVHFVPTNEVERTNGQEYVAVFWDEVKSLPPEVLSRVRLKKK